MTFDAYEVVIVPFPFSDKPVTRRRPAIILSPAPYCQATGLIVTAMVTTARASSWPYDLPLLQPRAAGLDRPCVIRLKLSTIDARLVTARVGMLADVDRARVIAQIRMFTGDHA